jgi:hypothetical protein
MMSGTYSNAPCNKKKVQKISITLANLEDFLVISIFDKPKIPIVDMKEEYYKFRNFFFEKK